MFSLNNLVAKYMRQAADKIDANTSKITEEQAIDILRVIAHEEKSKEQACDYLHISRSTFGDYVRNGYIPEGRKVKGFKELRWYKDELDMALYKMKKDKKLIS